MDNTNNEKAGPDLKAGVKLEELKPGQRLLGQVDGERALLINENGAFYAIGATCTHYGANLDEGIVTDGTIRCPWHHTCFNLKSGAVLKPPALNALPVWRTGLRDGKVFVGERLIPEKVPPRRANRKRFVIVGSGAAGHAAAEMLRREGFDGSLIMVSEDSAFPYDRPNLSKDFLAGSAPEDWIPLRSPDFYESAGIEIRLNTRAIALDPPKKTLQLEGGEELGYDKCLLATGGRPFIPPIAGSDLPHVHVLRSLADCRALIAALGIAKSIAIIGAGFIGLEGAGAFRTRGLDVTIIAPEDLPLAKVLGPEVGAFLKSVHEENGVRFVMKQTVRRIEPGFVVLDNGRTEPADLVLVAAGIKPDITLARGAGINCGNGIVVDATLKTSAEDVFAAGDVALWPDVRSGRSVRIEHWAVAQRQGQIAALNMLGQGVRYADVPFFWTHQADVTLNYVGHAGAWTKVVTRGELKARDCAVGYCEDDRLAALLTIGRDRESLEIERELERHERVKF